MIPYGASANYFSNPTGPYFTSGTNIGYSLTANSVSLPQITTPSSISTSSRININYGVSSGRMNGVDILDIRVDGSNLGYSSGTPSHGTGKAPCLTLSPILPSTIPASIITDCFFVPSGTVGTPSSGGLRVIVSSSPRALVPEP